MQKNFKQSIWSLCIVHSLEWSKQWRKETNSRSSSSFNTFSFNSFSKLLINSFCSLPELVVRQFTNASFISWDNNSLELVKTDKQYYISFLRFHQDIQSTALRVLFVLIHSLKSGGMTQQVRENKTNKMFQINMRTTEKSMITLS